MWYLILIAFVAQSSMASAVIIRNFGGGLSMAMTAEREVNPQYLEARSMPALFAQVGTFPYTLTLESGYERRKTSAGALSVANKSVSLSLWGRYEFGRPRQWSPFVSAGTGMLFDTVEMNYGDGQAQSRADGQRWQGGVGIGLTHVFFGHFLNELETRTVLIEDRSGVAWNVIYRMGYIY